MTEPAGIAPAATATATADPATAANPAAPTMTAPAAATAPTATAGSQPTAPTVEQLQAQLTAMQADNEKWKALSRKNETRAGENAAALQKAAEALGLTTAQTDPATIAAQLQASQAEAKSRAVELAVLRAATRLGADGDALLDSRGFLGRIKELDPGDAEGIKAAISAAVTEAPTKYALAGNTSTTTAATAQQPAQPPQRQASTGGEFNGQPGGQRQWTKADVDRASPAQVAKAMKDGLLRDYLAS